MGIACLCLASEVMAFSVPTKSTTGSYTVSGITGLYSGGPSSIYYVSPTSRSYSGRASGVYTHSITTGYLESSYWACQEEGYPMSYRRSNNNSNACLTGSRSTQTKTIIVVRTPGAPGAISFSPAALSCDASATVTWGAASGGSHYELNVKSRPIGGNWSVWSPLPSTSGTSYKHQNMQSGYDYQYRVRSRYYSSGHYSDWSGWRASTVMRNDCAPGTPPQPSLSASTVDTGASYSLTWGAATGRVTEYHLQEQRNNAGTWYKLNEHTNSSANLSQALSGQYCYRVSAANESGSSAYSQPACVSVNTPVLPAANPAAPVDKSGVPAIPQSDIVGATAGSFRVNESGAATYNIPIATATGTAGVVPQLALAYSSQQGSGIAGQGWSLSGLSTISRCRQTLQSDGQAKPITWSETDRFCLDGQKLLIVGNTSDYGRSNTRYKTEIDNFAVITAQGGEHGNPDYFTVERKDGSISYYGIGNNAKLAGANNHTLHWSISQFQDSVGNPIRFTYAGDSTNHRIERIDYAFDQTVDNNYYQPASGTAAASIQFEYEQRPDSQQNYIAGYALANTLRLRAIRSENDNILLRRYALTYLLENEQNDQVSRLRSVRECSRSDCLPATVFDWQLPNADFTDQYDRLIPLDTDNRDQNYLGTYKPADINGDGVLDIVWLTNIIDNTSATPSVSQNIKYIISPTDTTAAQASQLLDSWNIDMDGVVLSTLSYKLATARIEAIDYNADGRQDILLWYPKQAVGGGRWVLYLSVPRSDGSWKLEPSVTMPFRHDGDVNFADINSDGLIDVINYKAAKHAWYLVRDASKAAGSNLGYQFVQQQTTSSNTEYRSLHSVRGDFNGDGRVDALMVKGPVYLPYPGGAPLGDDETEGGASLPVDSRENVLLMAVDSGVMTEAPQPISVDEAISAFAVDVNNDGLSDLLWAAKEGDNYFIRHALSTGIGFAAVQSKALQIDMPVAAQDEWTCEWVTPPVSDTDEDVYGYNLPQAELHCFDDQGQRIADSIVRQRQQALGQSLTPDLSLLSKALKGLQVTDYNQDGYADIIWHNPLNRTLQKHTWDINSQQFGPGQPMQWGNAPITTSGKAEDQHMFLDMNGDGAVDYAQLSYGELKTYLNKGVYSGSRIKKVTNGLGAETVINYGALSKSDHYIRIDNAGTTETVTRQRCLSLTDESEPFCVDYTREVFTSDNDFYTEINTPFYGLNITGNKTIGLAVEQPTLLFNAAMYVVTEVSSSAPTAADNNAMSSIAYYYQQARLQAGGRGMLGFKYLSTVDKQTGIRTETQYRQDFPYIGMPINTRVYNKNADLISEAINRWDSKTLQAPYQPYIAESTETTYAIETSVQQREPIVGGVLQTTTTLNDYDDYGNLQYSKVTVQDSSGQNIDTVETHNHYGDSTYEHQKGRLRHSRVTKTRQRANGHYDEQERESAFTYHPSGIHRGLLATETLLPNGEQDQTLTTTYTYDDFGNRTRVTTQGWGGTTVIDRYADVIYDAKGRYVEMQKNYYGQITETIFERNEYGSVTKKQNINKVQTHIEYDRLGKAIQEWTQTGAWTQTHYRLCDASCPNGAAFTTHRRQAGGGQSIEYHDKLGRTIQQATLNFNGQWSKQSTEYDNLNRIVRTSEPYLHTPQYWTTQHYDKLGRVVQITGPDGSISKTHYNGLRTTVSNALNQTRTEERDISGQLVKVTDHLGGIIEYRYDTQNNLKQTTTIGTDLADGVPSSITVSIDYDKLGRKISMNDPDKGQWYYQYNAFGELICQQSARGQTTHIRYDELGRKKRRYEHNGPSSTCASPRGVRVTSMNWYYRNSGDSHDVGKLYMTLDTGLDHLQKFIYDELGRHTETATTLDYGMSQAKRYYEKTTYDQYGRVFQQYDGSRNTRTYRNHNGLQNLYNEYGYLTRIVDVEPDGSGDYQQSYFEIIDTDARGNILTSINGDGYRSEYQYDPATGRPLQTLVKSGSFGPVYNVMQLNTHWDSIGNLQYKEKQRWDNSGNPLHGGLLREDYQYDDLNRLTRAAVQGGGYTDTTFDSFGNIKSKHTYDALGQLNTDASVGHYSYHNAPHAVSNTSIGNHSYSYDANGNLTHDSRGRTLEYSVFDKPTRITKGSHTTTFEYGPNRQRYRRTDTTSEGTKTTVYIGGVEHITHPDGSKQIKRTINGVAIITQTYSSSGTLESETEHYQYKDHLGSTVLISEYDPQTYTTHTLHDMDFDAWGQRQGADYTTLTSSALTNYTTDITTRGYTGHEMLDAVGLIHMNGRVYDPRLARFIQADPIIDGAMNTQGYNRYSYVKNNPLNATDPSGYSLLHLAAERAHHRYHWQNRHENWDNIRPYVGAIVGVVLSAYCGSCGPVVAGMIGGAAGAAANGGNIIKGAIIGGFSAAAFSAIGGTDLQLGAKALAHGFTGGVLSVLQGGKFGHGFVSAGLTKAANINGILPNNAGTGADLLRTITAGVLGGTISEATGGKFANGAITAAFAQAFNGNEGVQRKVDRQNAWKALSNKQKLAVYKEINADAKGWLEKINSRSDETISRLAGNSSNDGGIAKLSFQSDLDNIQRVFGSKEAVGTVIVGLEKGIDAATLGLARKLSFSLEAMDIVADALSDAPSSYSAVGGVRYDNINREFRPYIYIQGN